MAITDNTAKWQVKKLTNFTDKDREIATQAQAEEGVDNTKIMTPKGVDYRLNKDRQLRTYTEFSMIKVSTIATPEEIATALSENSQITQYVAKATYINLELPCDGHILVRRLSGSTVSFVLYGYANNEVYFGYYRSYANPKFTGWRKLTTTSDIPAIATQAEAEAGTDNTKVMTPLGVLNSQRLNGATRPTTINFSPMQNGEKLRMYNCLAVGSCEGKPDFGDAHIFHMNHDNTGGYDIQLGIGTGTNVEKIGFRRQLGVSSTGVFNGWGDWKQLATVDEVAHLLQNNTNAQTIVGYKNSIYRGKYLGSSLTSAQSATIRAGVFDDLFVGDYWTIGGVNYRIAAFDYYYNCGDTACTTHHVVVVPDTILYSSQMNTENVTTGAYVGSAMYTTNLAQAKTTIGNAFGTDHLLTIRQYFSNAVTDGYESGGAWTDANVWLMNEHNVYGSPVFNNCIQGTNWANRYTIDNSQYPLFAMNPRMIHTRQTYWLRDVADSTSFAGVGGAGHCDYSGSSDSRGVRPAFLVY